MQPGDSFWSIASKFGLKPATILASNRLRITDVILPGQTLSIPPIDGVMVTVQPGQTLAAIARTWGVDIGRIANYAPNSISNPDRLVAGQRVIIPGAVPPQWAVGPEPSPAPIASTNDTSRASSAQTATTGTVQASTTSQDSAATPARSTPTSNQNEQLAQAASPTPAPSRAPTASKASTPQPRPTPTPAPTPTRAPPPSPTTAVAPAGIPPEQLPVIQAAAASCGLPWTVLAAVAKIESGFGRSMGTSSAGAMGYGQFLPSTWAAYGQGGNPYDYRDALPAMARYLCDNGAPQNLRAALLAYNPAAWYVDEVLAIAAEYQR